MLPNHGGDPSVPFKHNVDTHNSVPKQNSTYKTDLPIKLFRQYLAKGSYFLD